MELVDILRVLARHRLALVLGLLLAAVAGVAVQYRVTISPPALGERVSTSSSAQARLLLDAPEEPPIVDLDSGVATTLALRAGLLADLLATDRVRAGIARRIGVAPSELAVLGPAGDPPTIRVPLAVAAADAARVTHEAYVLSVAADTSIPIVSFSAAAPDATTARRIVAAAASSYEALVTSSAAHRSRLSVERLGPIRTSTTIDRPHPAFGIAAGIALFALWSGGIVLLVGLMRAWRGAADSQDSSMRQLVPRGRVGP